MSFPTVYYITQVIIPATRPGMKCACVSVSEPVYIGVLYSHKLLLNSLCRGVSLRLFKSEYNSLIMILKISAPVQLPIIESKGIVMLIDLRMDFWNDVISLFTKDLAY